MEDVASAVGVSLIPLAEARRAKPPPTAAGEVVLSGSVEEARRVPRPIGIFGSSSSWLVSKREIWWVLVRDVVLVGFDLLHNIC